jgi:hypothetical protein
LANLSEARGWRDSIAVLLVSVYLVGVGTFLILTRRIVAPSFLHVFCALMRSPYRGIVREMHPEHGYCFYTRLPSRLLSDLENVSSLLLFEDGRPLGPPHAPHDQLRALGGGRFSHWGAHLYFSTSDNSDPRFNGRRYTVKETPRSTSVFSRPESKSTDLGA